MRLHNDQQTTSKFFSKDDKYISYLHPDAIIPNEFITKRPANLIPETMNVSIQEVLDNDEFEISISASELFLNYPQLRKDEFLLSKDISESRDEFLLEKDPANPNKNTSRYGFGLHYFERMRLLEWAASHRMRNSLTSLRDTRFKILNRDVFEYVSHQGSKALMAELIKLSLQRDNSGKYLMQILKGDGGHWPLRHAAISDHETFIVILRAYTKDNNFSELLSEALSETHHNMLINVAAYGNPSTLSTLIAAYPNSNLLKEGLRAENHAALFLALKNGCLENCKILINTYLKIDPTGKFLAEGFSANNCHALTKAVMSGSNEVVELVIETLKKISQNNDLVGMALKSTDTVMLHYSPSDIEKNIFSKISGKPIEQVGKECLTREKASVEYAALKWAAHSQNDQVCETLITALNKMNMLSVAENLSIPFLQRKLESFNLAQKNKRSSQGELHSSFFTFFKVEEKQDEHALTDKKKSFKG